MQNLGCCLLEFMPLSSSVEVKLLLGLNLQFCVIYGHLLICSKSQSLGAMWLCQKLPQMQWEEQGNKRKAPLLLPCRTSFPCPRHSYKQLLMRKMGIRCGEWEENINLEEVKETGEGRSLGAGVANWSLGKNSSDWKKWSSW